MITKTKIHRSEYDRSEWPDASQVHVSEPDADGTVTVTELVSDRPSWVEKDCAGCAGNAPGGFFPPHTATDRCQSGRHNHCTCDSCF